MAVKKKSSKKKVAKKKPAKRKTTKRKTTKKKVTKRKPAAKKVTKKRVTAKKPRKKVTHKKPSGYVTTPGGLVVPEGAIDPVPPSKLSKGLSSAMSEIESFVDQVVSKLSNTAEVEQVELDVSFSADGKFLGFGVGGAVSVRITITPDAD